MTAPPRAAAVVVAGGRGARLADPAKALLPLAGRPMLAWSLDALAASAVGPVVVVAGEHTQPATAALAASGAWPRVAAVVVGGERRQDSVAAGLAALEAVAPDADVVLVHDAARPLATPGQFDACAAAAFATGAAVVAVPVADTLKRVAGGRVAATVDRGGLWAAQTPQGFRRDVLARLRPLVGGAATVTDEATLCEQAGLPVAIVPGSAANLKVTHPADVAVADALLRARLAGGEGARVTRTGIGYDVHRFAAGRRLVLGGVEIAHERGLEGHSDADVLLHAIADALLGAAALGDIGRHFPPSDPRFAGADSGDLLREVARLLREAGWAPVNVDATLIAEAPRIGPHAAAMRERIAACLGLPPDAVGVKATTNEGMGFVGRGEGIAALATAAIAPLPAGR